jgi:hypothetical protein
VLTNQTLTRGFTLPMLVSGQQHVRKKSLECHGERPHPVKIANVLYFFMIRQFAL